MFHLLISFGWINIFCVKRRYSWDPGSAAGPKCVGSVQCKAGTAGFSVHMLSAVFNYPGGDYVEGKNHPWLAVTWRALACQLPHKPVLPPLGSSTQVWELIILIQEKQLHNNKTKQANKTKENKNQDKPPNKQVNLRKVYRHLTLPFLPLGHAAYFPGNCSPAAACPCQADGREKGISLQKESDPTPHRHSTVFPYGRTEHINRANGNRKQNLKALSFSVHMGFQLFSSRLHYRTSWQWDAGSSVPSTSLSADVLGKKRLSAS